jgi:hypothetical protein
MPHAIPQGSFKKESEMSKTIQTILNTRLWVSHIDDERSDGNSIIVTLDKDYVFIDERDCGVRGFDTLKELEQGTRFANIIHK